MLHYLRDDHDCFLGLCTAAKRHPHKERQAEHCETHPHARFHVAAAATASRGTTTAMPVPYITTPLQP